MRLHVAAVYAFARTADDFADEGHRTQDERLALLDEWKQRLLERDEIDVSRDCADDRDLVFVALGNSIRVCELPISLFDDLLSAFRQDVTIYRYRTWDELLDYCQCSANPVGRLVLRIAGYQDRELDLISDRVCTALQITNFLQDLGVDWRRGRLYIPTEIYEAFNARLQALDGNHLPPEWRAVVEQVAERTREMFDEGRRIFDVIDGRFGFELRLTWLGGRRILDRLEQSGYDPLVRRPALGLADFALVAWRALSWRHRTVLSASSSSDRR